MGRPGTEDLRHLLGPGKSGKSLTDSQVRWFLGEDSDMEELCRRNTGGRAD